MISELMIRLMTALAILFSAAVAGRADEPPGFGGEWKTTMGPVTLEQKGQDVTGRIEFFRLPLEGKVEGKELKLGYDEGQIHVDATLGLEPSGNAFKGTFKSQQWESRLLERLAARPGREQRQGGRLFRALADRPGPDGAEPRRCEGEGPICPLRDIEPGGRRQEPPP